MSTPHFQKGTQTKVAVVFSCPGQKEELSRIPVSGKTGENLEVLLQELYKLKKIPNKIRKVDLRITNAWDKVLYHSKDDRTEGKLNATEIYSTNNINRLNKELNDITDLIICFGYNAKQSLKKLTLKNKPKILFGPHLGLQSINRNKNLKTDITGNTIVRGKNANYLRLQKIAYEL